MKRDIAALYGQIDLEFEAVEDENKGNQEEEGSNTEDVDTVDDMSKSWELNIGEKSDFKGHIEEVVKYKLNSIPKLSSIDYTLDKKVILFINTIEVLKLDSFNLWMDNILQECYLQKPIKVV